MPQSKLEYFTGPNHIAPRDIIEIFRQKHIDLCLNHPGIVRSQYGTERESTKDYEGRVIFELFQNAIDRADRYAVIILEENTLTIANDGQPFSIYQEERKGGKSDFHSLCTIYDSAKKTGESIGNKGVGFKSVWNISRKVVIESFDETGVPFGFQLTNPHIEEDFEDLQVLDILQKFEKKVPSFYFPKFFNSGPLFCSISKDYQIPVQTRVTVSLNEELDREMLSCQLDELRTSQLFFIKLLKKQLHPEFCVYIVEKNELTRLNIDNTWFRTELRENENSERYRNEIAELQQISKNFGLQYSNLPEEPNVAIAFPPAGYKGASGIVYTYLPTKVNFGFNVLVHADFVLDNSRQTIPPNAYNNKLIKIAIKIFTDTILENTRFHNDPEFYRYLSSPTEIRLLDGRHHKEIVWEIFTRQGRLRRTLKNVYSPAKNYLEQSYAGIIAVIKAATLRDYGEHHETWHNRIRPFLKMFVGPEINIIPLNDGTATFMPDPDGDYGHLFLKEGSRDLGFNADTQLKNIPEIKITTYQDLKDPIFTKWAVKELTILGLLSEMGKVQKKYSGDTFVHEQIFALAFIIAKNRARMDFANYFITSILKEEREISKLLVPVTNNGWHVAISAYYNAEFEDWIDTDYFRAVDLKKCQDILSRVGLDHKETEIISIISRMGVWCNKLPLKWSKENNSYHFHLPWKEIPKYLGLKGLINTSLPYIAELPANHATEIILKLKNSPWFNVSNFEGGFPPSMVFLFSSKDRRQLPDILKENKMPEYELLYRELGIQSIEETRNEAKLMDQLTLMKETAKGKPTQAQAELYRALTLSLSRVLESKVDLAALPILYKHRQGFAYRQHQEEQIWFVPVENKRLRIPEMEIKTAYFSEEIRRQFISRLGLNVFDPTVSIDYDLQTKQIDHITKAMITNCHMPVFFALAEEAMGENLIREEALERWMRLEIIYSKKISMQIDQQGLDSARVPSIQDSNVFYQILSASRRLDNSQVNPISHDIKEDIVKSLHLSKFSAGIADSVFRNQQLTETFRAYLDRCFMSVGNLDSELLCDFFAHNGITKFNIEKERSFLEGYMLQDHEWDEFIEVLRDTTGLTMLSKANWTAAEIYEKSNIRYRNLFNAIGTNDKFQNILVLIDPSVRNRYKLGTYYLHIQALYYLTHGSTDGFSEEIFKAKINHHASELDHFHFSIETYYHLFAVKSFPSQQISLAIIKIQDGLADLSQVGHDEEPVPPSVSMEDIGSGKVGNVDFEKVERERKAQQENGIKVETGLIRNFLAKRNPIYDIDMLVETRRMLEFEIQKKIKGNLTAYLKKLDEAILNKKCSNEELGYFLHISNSVGDGLGYDLLLPDLQTDPLRPFRVEVKSSRGNSKKIYFSRNEIRRITSFSEKERWRLWYNGRCDAILSAQVQSRIAEHWALEKKIRKEKLSYLTGDKWMLEFGRGLYKTDK